MTEIKFYKSVKKSIKLVFVCTPFILISFFMLIYSDHTLLGWFGITIFGFGYPIAIYNILDKRPQIIINETGIFDRRIIKEVINWENIKGAYITNIDGHKYISIVLQDSFKQNRQKNTLRKWTEFLNKAVGGQEFNLNLAQLDVDEVKLTNFINEMIKIQTETPNWRGSSKGDPRLRN